MADVDTDGYTAFQTPHYPTGTEVEVDLEPEYSELVGPDGKPVAIYMPFPVGFDLSPRGGE